MTKKEILSTDLYDFCGSASIFMSDEDKIKYYSFFMEDEIVLGLENTKLWKLKPIAHYGVEHWWWFDSDMFGYTDGRYKIGITKLGRKVEGKLYKISIYWTPYNPSNLVFKGRFNTFEELTEIIKSVNSDLLDVSRVNK